MIHKALRGIIITSGVTLASAGCAHAGPLRVIADTNTPTPGDGRNFATFGQLDGVDPAISGENIAFGGTYPTGIYALIDGELKVIATVNTEAPGGGGTFGFGLTWGSSPSISGENVAFAGFRSGGSGIYAYIDGALQIVADTDTPVPGGVGTFSGFNVSSGTSPAISGENVVFAAADRDNDTFGIYARIGGELRMIADTNTLVPGRDVTFLGFSTLNGATPSISGENVAFMALWSSVSGVYAYINGELRTIADSTMTPPGGGFFRNFGYAGGGPSISGKNVAFRGETGIYAYINGELRLIANTDTVAPGSTGKFQGFPASPRISGANIVFGARAEGLGVAGGVFAAIDGNIRVIATTNTMAPSQDTTFGSFYLQDSSAGEDLRPAISGRNVVFGAKPNGVYAFIPPTRGDFDDDFCVSLKDVGAFQRCLGETTEGGAAPCLAAFDFDDNSLIDLADHAELRAILAGP